MTSQRAVERGASVLIDAGSLTRCRHRLYLDTAYSALLRQEPENPGVRQRREAARAQRDAIRSSLSEALDGWTEIEAPDARTASELTMAACRRRVPWIWNAVLPIERTTGRRGRSEILMLDPVDGGYLPIIVVNHKVTDPGRGARTSPLIEWAPVVDETRKVRSQLRDQLRLAHLYRMLDFEGIASPNAEGGAIGYRAECILVHDLTTVFDVYDARFLDRLSVARGESFTVPSQVSECRSCPWWTDCRPQLVANRDVSLVASGMRADALREQGVSTIDELADFSGPEPDNWPFGSFTDAVAAATAWRAGVPLLRRTDTVSVHRADVEVDVDMESYQEHGAYMWGTLLTEKGGPPAEYRGFVTWDPLPTVDEGRSFAEFWAWLMGKRADAALRGKTFAAYCYSRAAEDKWLLDSARRFGNISGVPSEAEIREFIDSEQWVDIYQAVSDQFICPNGKGLKKIAPVAGFEWRDAEAGGEASMGWYREAVGYDAEPDATQRERLLVYNEDDVRATKVLREWMSDRAEIEIPTLESLRAAV
ncbi:TM0106 family RecB-like putative nuclease [Rhodococcus sp. H36-A4]|uniref:TM0106 family RecB-like putative nuclease n=1 Tax=Rhodococcus sp. H36-A4 TaxID=3004353 RepID=UPI0022AF0F1A|nr:TM0106 family RecB-like putative nuclease [Rhodococcus sp. H36-A4]MCZ4077384.1 TM0106 family RecB-like putative nuclease [Rhodococcus sp. H36-A4]